MSFGDWFRRIFSPSSGTPSADAGATEAAPDGMAGAPGLSGFAEIETAQAVEGVAAETEAPPDPAP